MRDYPIPCGKQNATVEILFEAEQQITELLKCIINHKVVNRVHQPPQNIQRPTFRASVLRQGESAQICDIFFFETYNPLIPEFVRDWYFRYKHFTTTRMSCFAKLQNDAIHGNKRIIDSAFDPLRIKQKLSYGISETSSVVDSSSRNLCLNNDYEGCSCYIDGMFWNWKYWKFQKEF